VNDKKQTEVHIEAQKGPWAHYALYHSGFMSKNGKKLTLIDILQS